MTADWQCSGMQKKHQTFIKIIHNIMRGVAVAHYSSNQRRKIATSCAFCIQKDRRMQWAIGHIGQHRINDIFVC